MPQKLFFGQKLINMTIKRIFNRLVIEITKVFLNDYFYLAKSYSQEGEDLILSRYFPNQRNGYYIDIGAHHPKRLSNTYLFYKMGWRGINIDAMPGSMKAFNKFRKRDINLEIGVSEKEDELTYFIFNEPALNSFSKEHANIWSQKAPYEIKQQIKVKTLPLNTILKRHLPPKQKIDFLSIDVEGLDSIVIDSNNWELFRPEIVIIEDHTVENLDSINGTEIFEKMISLDYKLISKCYYSLMFRDNRTS